MKRRTARAHHCCGLILAAWSLSGASHANAQMQALLIGGGNSVHNSQVQIEANVIWTQDILKQLELPVQTYFADGDEPGHDVYYQVEEEQHSSDYEPLARVFGDWTFENRRYRNNAVPELDGGTARQTLEPELQHLFSQTLETDLLILFNGHGGEPATRPDQATIDLWNNTSLSAGELHALVEPRNAPLRFVFTQCYSGGFHRLAYRSAEGGLTLAATPRCGFTSTSAHSLSEGCSASVNSEDYRDYTTYFFSALSGTLRDGTPIVRNPDSDLDGVTTLREAHLYTLAEAVSTDLPRSTSEDYLMQWQPWYLRWLPEKINLPNNEYADLYRRLAIKNEIPLDENAATVIEQATRFAERIRDQVLEEHQSARQEMIELQYQLQIHLADRWPALLGPYTGEFQAMATSGELIQVANSVLDDDRYLRLRELQNQQKAQEEALLELDRQLVQYRKMAQMRHLAQLQEQLTHYGTEDQQKDYESLVRCEDTSLNSALGRNQTPLAAQ